MSSRSDRALGSGAERALLSFPLVALAAAAAWGRPATRELHAATLPTAADTAASDVGVLQWATSARPGERLLRVCADPNNMPFTNRAGAGI